ncbi:MAG: hydrogenase expression/formation protein HypE [Candidatus Handelsmanbacteria bacterium RIFCSPLOWO2_12_FULL_64_10]|uniref:Hydrogenase expression/formation protein HypE n=1 Tax=Handelsmanbacteria sp. (strain RIFCSPLOWO2_12_FULL_64_10) TaxID=1817868 RepID=A0A1F6C6B5_HANXR|nr:MAG: hydrogenase expression/formation protein HypE [Candidatus Handelsmanbacteria bacterium RIFCSPLOWO2_12_FULL_64_10]
MNQTSTLDIPAGLACPAPLSDSPTVLLAHGGGGSLMHRLIEEVFLPAFRNPFLEARGDGAVLPLDLLPFQRLAFTTDTYVVRPLFFPGGDIGSLAVHGTVNDLAMCGARPLYLSAGFLIEEGLPMETLRRVVGSVQRAAQEAGVQVVTGDTKVVDRGKGDGVYINTAGIGILEYGQRIGPHVVAPGDVLLLNGDVGRHGTAIVVVREGLAFESAVESDSASLAGLVMKLLEDGIEVHCMRDLTRGGLASALNEVAGAAGVGIEVDEGRIPVREDVQAVCEVLGLDPLHVACEGRFVAFVAHAYAERALTLMRSHPLGADACIIGCVGARHAAPLPGMVTMRSRIGSTRVLDVLSGEQLPRIC